MCGIAGYIGATSVPEDRLTACLARMGRRGPDASGRFHARHASGRHTYLLHSRLSIIDLDPRSNQPFTRGDHTLVFNGELYNYLELRRALPGPWDTESDTEVLLRALTDRGAEGLDTCEGMWAFALHDARTGETLLGRDRFGEKPLFLVRDATGIYFASEVKFLTALIGRPFAVNHRHLHRYLVNGYKALYKTGERFHEGVEELAPGHVLRIDPEGRERLARYWSPAFHPDDALDYADCVGLARERLVDSVRMRLRADVPLAFCMSGGIDSNALIGIAKRELDYDVHGFTIVNTDARYDEWDLVDHSARELGIRHTAVPVTTRDFLPRLRELIRYHDAPVSTITYYAQWLLMEQIAGCGYKIAVSGTGADELFSGYYDHHIMYLYEVRDDAARFAEARREWETHIKPLVRNPYLRDPELFVNDATFRDHIYLQADEFAATLKTPFEEGFAETHYCDDLLRNRMMNELFYEAVPVILHEDDLNAMYFSVENRSPFLDRRLFDACYSFPTRHLLQRGFAKVILRDAVRGLAPDKVLDTHRKVGFNAPIHSFLDVNDRTTREYLLDDSPIFDHLHRDRIEALLNKAALPNSESKFLFYFVNCKIFLEESLA